MPYDHKVIQREIDNYVDTVWAIVAFVHECRWHQGERRIDEAVPFGVGRTMRKSNRVKVTPDTVIQRRPTQGIVAEVKHTFPPEGENTRRNEVFEQLKSYDEDLEGWWTDTGEIEAHDIVLLTHLTHAVDAVDHFRNLSETRSDIGGFERNLAIVGYFRNEQMELFLTLKKEHGDLLDGEFSEKLRHSVPISIRHIEALQKKFYDSCPPIPYILWLLWDFVFPIYAEGIERDRARGYTPISITVEQVTSDLQRYYGYEADSSGNMGIPRSEWVQAALGALGSFHMAHRGDAPGSHVIRYKRIYGGTLERFGQLFFAREERRRRREARQRRERMLFDDM